MNPYVESIISEFSDPWGAIARRVIEDCRTPPNGEPAFNEEDTNCAAYEIALAIRDCGSLDEWEGSTFFSSRLMAALSDPRAYAGLAWIIMDDPDMKKMKPILSVIEQGPEPERRARAIHALREHVRDGMPVDEALFMIGPRLQEIAASNSSLEFFMKTLPEVLKEITARPERFGRSMKGWIKRAWIPLGLWTDANNPQKVHDLLDRARKCYLPASGIAFQYERDFLPAWNKIKPTRRKGISVLP